MNRYLYAIDFVYPQPSHVDHFCKNTLQLLFIKFNSVIMRSFSTVLYNFTACLFLLYEIERGFFCHWHNYMPETFVKLQMGERSEKPIGKYQ
jgi:hypothetical protein